MKTPILLTVVATTGLLFSCSSKQDASADNFASAIGPVLQLQKACVSASSMSAESSMAFINATSNQDKNWEAQAVNLLRNNKGVFLEILPHMFADGREKERRDEFFQAIDKGGIAWGYGITYGYRPVSLFPIPRDVLVLSGENMAYFDEQAKGVCVGRYKLSKILGWSAPTAFAGLTVTEVSYQAKLIDVPQWAQAWAQRHHGTVEGKMALNLTNNGWSPMHSQ